MNIARVLAFSGTLLALAAPAAAQTAQPPCFDNEARQWDLQSSASWELNMRSADPGAMQKVAGTWYLRTQDPQSGMINDQYQSYELGGNFQYRDQTCSSTGCSNNQGVGEWTARPLQGGAVYVMVRFSDLQRTSQCFGFAAQFPSAGAMIVNGGGPWQRVQ